MQQGFLMQILLLAQHVSGTTMPIIRSSRVLYSGCYLWYFVLWFSSCWSGAELRVMCPVCRMLQHPANRTHFCNMWACCRYYKFGNNCSIYSKSWFIQHLWNEWVAGYHRFPHFRTLCIMRMLGYIAINIMEMASSQLFC